MVNEKASKWVIGILIYFILLSSVFVLVANFRSEYSITDTDMYNSSGGNTDLIFAKNLCASPRFDVGSLSGNSYFQGLERDLYNPRYSLLVEKGLINNNDTCEIYAGASWEEETFLFFWGTGSFTCKGIINQTFYNDGVSYANSTALGLWDKPVCGLSELQDDEVLCESFGCTYYTEDLIKDVTTLRVEFYTDNSLANGVLTFFLIWIPVIGLLLAIYEMIRG